MTNAVYVENMKITSVEFAENYISFLLYVYQHQVSPATTCITHFTNPFQVFYWKCNALNTIKP